MHKRKDGKVVASLTEVKNKTGDIFSLVDEFGEILLTSYNKPKYKISKVDISETLSLKEEEVEEKKSKNVISRVTETVNSLTGGKTESKNSIELLSQEVIKKFSKLKAWDRFNSQEKVFVSKATKPLQ